MKAPMIMISSLGALALALAGGLLSSHSAAAIADGAVPTAGDFQTALNDAKTKSYLKTTNITEYNGVSGYPWADHQPMNTAYTSAGLYMQERGSGYYTYQNAIWHIKKDGDTETRALSMSQYQSYDAYYRTLGSFGASYVADHLEPDTSDSSGLTMKNKGTYSNEDMIQMIYFVAPLVTVDEKKATFANSAVTFKIKLVENSYILDAMALTVDIIQNEVTGHLVSSATFSGIGATALGYDIPA